MGMPPDFQCVHIIISFYNQNQNKEDAHSLSENNVTSFKSYTLLCFFVCMSYGVGFIKQLSYHLSIAKITCNLFNDD